MKKNKLRYISGVAILTAITVILGLVGTYAPKFQVSINFALIPIVIGACVYGPLAGLFLGLVDGVICIVDPATISSFWAFNPVVTIILCLLKTGLAGLCAGFIYKFLRKKNQIVASTVAAFFVPLINTTTFIIGVLLFFVPLYDSWAGGAGKGLGLLFTATLLINLLVEIAYTALLSPAIHRIIKIATKNVSIGDVYEDEEETKEIPEEIDEEDTLVK
ncbi:MAG: ECF transporter S component [Bacilli bacterium]